MGDRLTRAQIEDRTRTRQNTQVRAEEQIRRSGGAVEIEGFELGGQLRTYGIDIPTGFERRLSGVNLDAQAVIKAANNRAYRTLLARAVTQATRGGANG